MDLKYPWLLLLFLLYIPIIWWYIVKHRGANASISISSTRAFAHLGTSWRVIMVHACFVLRLLALGCVIVALCRPQGSFSSSSNYTLGTDIVLCLDISPSMQTEDMSPDRFTVAKNTALEFVNQRQNDNIGLVTFSAYSMSRLPLTNDHAMIANTLNALHAGDQGDMTAIGNGMASAINRVRAGNSVSKSIILLTDGTDNASDIDPTLAAEIARDEGIRIYTIGVGRDGVLQIPNDPFGRSATTIETRIDEDLLRNIAQMTGGEYFRATDEKMLRNVYKEIDKLEKSRIEVEKYNWKEEQFPLWVAFALGLLAFEQLIRYTVTRRIP